jgi:thymidylate synthase
MSAVHTDGTRPADQGSAPLNTFDAQYRHLVERIMRDGVEEVNARTQHAVRALPGVTVEIEDVAGDFPLLTLRKIPLRTFIAEQIWFLTGERVATDVLSQNTHIWDDFTNLNGVIGTAYGYRWRRHFHRDQIAELVELFERDPSSRQGVVIAWDPSMDGLAGGVQRKNVPCPFAFTVNIIGSRLNLHNIVRSNDVLLGMPHDVAGFALLQHILAKRLGVRPGKYTHSISHAHIYDIHYDAARTLAERVPAHPPIALDIPDDAYERALGGDVALVAQIEGALARQYHPQPALPKLRIVL